MPLGTDAARAAARQVGAGRFQHDAIEPVADLLVGVDGFFSASARPRIFSQSLAISKRHHLHVVRPWRRQ